MLTSFSFFPKSQATALQTFSLNKQKYLTASKFRYLDAGLCTWHLLLVSMDAGFKFQMIFHAVHNGKQRVTDGASLPELSIPL